MIASKSYGDRIYLACVYVFLAFVFVITFYPFWNILVLSLNSADDSVRGGIYLWPRVINFGSYKQILQDAEILNGLKVTVLRTIVGTPLALAVISLVAFALSKRDLVEEESSRYSSSSRCTSAAVDSVLYDSEERASH